MPDTTLIADAPTNFAGATPAAASTFDHAALMEDMAKYDDLVEQVADLMIALGLMDMIDIDKLAEEEFEELAKVRDGLLILRRARA